MNIPEFIHPDIQPFKDWCMSNEEYIVNQLSNLDSSISYNDMEINNAYLIILLDHPPDIANAQVIYIVRKDVKYVKPVYGYILGNFWKERFSGHDKDIPLWLWGGFKFVPQNTFGGYYIIPLAQARRPYRYLNWPNDDPLNLK